MAVTPRTTVSTLNDVVLLNIFDWYRLYNTTDEDQAWNQERWWYKPIHVCRKWRHLILTSPTRLDLHLVCTYGIPVEAMLSHSPPLPLIIYYPKITGKTPAADEESALFALQQRERVRRIHVVAPTTNLRNLFKAMDNELPMLERLSLHSSTESRTGLVLPGKLQAPLLRHLTLSNIALPIQSPLLRLAEDLITLRLCSVPASPEFHPAHLVAQLSGMSRLENLMIHFYAATPNREVERRLRNAAQAVPITLPSLKVLAFRGGSAYLEGILARLSAPLLSTLDIEFFNQLTFDLSHLLQFARTTGEFTFRSAEMHFRKEFVSMVVDPHLERAGTYPFLVKVMCQPLDWQATCAAQICRALEPLLAGVDSLTFGFHKDCPGSWQDEIDHAQWHGLLRTFARVTNLQLTGGLVEDLFRFLRLDEAQVPLALLLGPQKQVPGIWGFPIAQITTTCKECDRHFNFEESRRQHSEDKHWYCREHDQAFKTKPALHLHYKRYPDHHYCFGCERDFDDEDELWDHLVGDHNACEDCRKLFDNYSELQKHDHEVHTYCTECDRSFQKESNLRQHLNSKLHRSSTVTCPGRGCNKSFISPTARTQHFESGACRSGLTLRQLNRLVVRADRNNHITNPMRSIGGRR
ncbi:hypothetical protein BJY52DRAFT_1228930 [Lactarius psammicola]|nr:hypothetical protein BJY52DRAFT_1228930 [Lactarius psammicola]